jgi:hypothetical protein
MWGRRINATEEGVTSVKPWRLEDVLGKPLGAERDWDCHARETLK